MTLKEIDDKLYEMPDLTLRLQSNTICYFDCPFAKNCIGKIKERNFMFICNIKKLKQQNIKDKNRNEKCNCI